MSGFPIKKTFLVLLLIACLAAVVWTSYLLFTDGIEPIAGIIILIVNIGVLIWNISVLGAHSVGAGTIVSIFLIFALLGATISAFAGVEPFSGVKDRVVEYFSSSSTEPVKTVWVEDITVGPRVPVLLLTTDLRLVTVNLRASEAVFEGGETTGCKVELWSGNYYYGYYNVLLRKEYIDHVEEFGIDLQFPVPADEPVFQNGGSFSTKVSTNPRWIAFSSDEWFWGLHDNPYSGLLE